MTRAALLLLAGFALGCDRPPPRSARPDELLPVLPPGQEPLFSAMLGGPDLLPGGCRLASAHVTTRQVTAQYRCASEPEVVTLELHHPATAPPGATRAGGLAVYARTPAAKPLGLFDAVIARVRPRESAVRWIEAAAVPEARTAPARSGSVGVTAAPRGLVRSATPRAPGTGGTPRAPGAGTGPWYVRDRSGQFSVGRVLLGALLVGALWEARRRARRPTPPHSS
jgi:hypothetical protein